MQLNQLFHQSLSLVPRRCRGSKMSLKVAAWQPFQAIHGLFAKETHRKPGNRRISHKTAEEGGFHCPGPFPIGFRNKSWFDIALSPGSRESRSIMSYDISFIWKIDHTKHHQPIRPRTNSRKTFQNMVKRDDGKKPFCTPLYDIWY